MHANVEASRLKAEPVAHPPSEKPNSTAPATKVRSNDTYSIPMDGGSMSINYDHQRAGSSLALEHRRSRLKKPPLVSMSATALTLYAWTSRKVTMMVISNH